ncbi:MAG: hypothetical protein JKY93_02140 [Gammaproteobacteria bacterium]|nr:hypothetical protein [Gammaproteobacteria bacterium]
MKYILRNIKILLVFVMALSPLACASKEVADIKLQEIEVDVVLRGWNQKGFGDKISTSTISIITTPDYKGDIVILRMNKNASGFTAEVYKPKPDALNPELWEFVSGDIEKSIVKQPSGNFHLSEMVDEGVRVEVIDLEN